MIPNESRNVVNFYKYWETDHILADLDEKRNNFSILCCNIVGDFNIGTIIRNGNAFLAKEVIFYGSKKYDRRSAVGTMNYTHFKHFRRFDDLCNLKEYIKDYRIVCVDNVESAKPIEMHTWDYDKHTLFVFGEEQAGIATELFELAHDIVYIKQYGSVRSLNVGCASSIVMYDYMNKKG